MLTDTRIGSSGWCGMGPDFCTKPTCVANCDAKSECDPGWGAQWSNSTKCPLNVCCSKFGFCGTSNDFCGGVKVNRPACSASSTSIQKVIGYYESWSLTERSCNGMTPEQIPYGIYTHINFAFATIDSKTFEVKASSAEADELMTRMKNVKIFQNGVKVWVAIGGWTFNDPGEPTANTFSELAASPAYQETFANSLISMMSTYGFDGVDIDWEYPRADDRNGKPEDYKNLVSWMKSLKEKLGTKGLSITIPSSFWYLQHFDIVSLQPHVDWFNVMLYDLHGSWDLRGNYPMPYTNSHTNLTEIQNSLDLLWRNEINPDKVVFGMAYYGRSSTMADPSCSTTGCLISSGGNPGNCSGTAGVLLNPEIQAIIVQNKLTPKLDQAAAVKTISWGNQWVSYDDADTWAIKAKLLKEQCIKNVMVWAISHDDLNGTYGKALTKALGREVMESPVFEPQETIIPPSIVRTCKWTNCNEGCPSGFKNVPRDGTNEMMTDGSLCMGLAPSQFCCPADQEQPTCLWRGHKNSGACKPGCNADETEVGTLSVGCSSRHQSACCTALPGVEAYNDCKWVGSSDLCSKSGGHADCPSDYPKFIVASSAGAGGEQICTQGAKSYCCKDPAPSQWTNCDWYKKATHNTKADIICETSCPDNSIRVSRQKGDCLVGWQAYCCAGAPPPVVVPRDPSFGNNQYAEFSGYIDEYMKDTTCPARIFGESSADLYYDSPQKRSDISTRQGPGCTRSNFKNLLNFVGSLISNYILVGAGLRAVWDTRVAEPIDVVLGIDSLANDVNSMQWNAFSFMNGVLLHPMNAALGMRQRRAAGSELCTYPQPIIGTRDSDLLLDELSEKNVSARNDAEGRIEDRYVTPNAAGAFDPTAAGAPPSMLTVLNGINRGDLTINYARWQYMALGGQGGPTLELAYWIGPNAGVAPTAAEEAQHQLNSYRDRTGGRTGVDRWVVMHIHFNPGDGLLAEFNGHTYIGTNSIRVYHGQQTYSPMVRGQATAPRVANQVTTTTNRRSGVITCPSASRWYIGARQPVPTQGRPQPTELTDALQTWGEGLWNHHYLDSSALRYIFDVDVNDPSEIYIRNRQPPLRLTRSDDELTFYNWRYDSQGNYVEDPYVPQ